MRRSVPHSPDVPRCDDSGRRRAACALVVVSMFFFYFERANASFSLGQMPANELRVELDRWAAWHWVRSGLSLAALTAAILAAWQ